VTIYSFALSSSHGPWARILGGMQNWNNNELYFTGVLQTCSVSEIDYGIMHQPLHSGAWLNYCSSYFQIIMKMASKMKKIQLLCSKG
jgi:hypothetical protein